MTTFELVLLLDSVDNGLAAFAMVAGGVAIISLIQAFMLLELRRPTEAQEASVGVAFKRAFKAGVFVAVFFVLSFFCPSSHDLMKAHIMAEGSQVLTADTVKLVTEELSKKIDTALAK